MQSAQFFCHVLMGHAQAHYAIARGATTAVRLGQKYHQRAGRRISSTVCQHQTSTDALRRLHGREGQVATC